MVAKLCDLLEALGGVACEQVKEKFGGLRFYVSINETCPDPDLAYLLVDACERASYKTCRTCGQPSVLRRDGTMWLAALCNACGEGWEVV